MAGIIEIREDNTEKVLSALQQAKHKGLVAIGLTAERHAKKNCPVDTGRLRNSITYVISGYATHVQSYRRSNVVGGTQKKHTRYNYGNEIMEGKQDEAVYIGTNVEYARYQEFGTSRGIKPVRFLTRAATEHTAEYKALMENSLKNA